MAFGKKLLFNRLSNHGSSWIDRFSSFTSIESSATNSDDDHLCPLFIHLYQEYLLPFHLSSPFDSFLSVHFDHLPLLSALSLDDSQSHQSLSSSLHSSPRCFSLVNLLVHQRSTTERLYDPSKNRKSSHTSLLLRCTEEFHCHSYFNHYGNQSDHCITILYNVYSDINFQFNFHFVSSLSR